MENFNRAAFTALVAENSGNEPTLKAIFDLLEFADKNALIVRGGKDDKTFHYTVSTRGGSEMLFYCDSYGGVAIYLSNFPQLKSADVSRFVRKLYALDPDAFKYILGFEEKRVKGGAQVFSIKETLVNPKIMKAFKAAILEIQKKIEVA